MQSKRPFPSYLRALYKKGVLLAGAASLAACASTPAPQLTAISSDTGYPRQLLAVSGDTSFASVVWDPGLPSETVITNGLAGTNYFQIPTNATAGAHQVALRSSGGQSNTATVTVIGCRTIVGPGGLDDGEDGPSRPPPAADDIVIDSDDLVLEPGEERPPPPNPGPLEDAVADQDLEAAAGPEDEAPSALRVGPDLFGGVNCGPWPSPRIEDIAFYRTIPGGYPNFPELADFLITVSAANLDTNARVFVARILGADTPEETRRETRELTSCVRWGALPVNYMQQHIPGTFRYPVYHYAQMLCPMQQYRFESVLEVSVINVDGKTDTRRYTMPASFEALDSDGDGLTDALENNGAANVDLVAMGANPLRKSLFIEVDWTPNAQPMNGVWNAATMAFATAPVLNPDGSAGIDLILDVGQGGAFNDGGETLQSTAPAPPPGLAPQPDVIGFDATPPAGTVGYVSFYTHKNANFDPARQDIFHYAVFADTAPDQRSGRGEIWGNDFYMSFATGFTQWSTLSGQVGTFVHELGHNLNLRHGGVSMAGGELDVNETRKPNQMSSMNYKYQFSGVSTNCDFTAEVPNVFTYAQGQLRPIDEANVNENIGICDGQLLDMNFDTTITIGTLNANPRQGTPDDVDTTDVHHEYDEWGRIQLNVAADPDRNDAND